MYYRKLTVVSSGVGIGGPGPILVLQYQQQALSYIVLLYLLGVQVLEYYSTECNLEFTAEQTHKPHTHKTASMI